MSGERDIKVLLSSMEPLLDSSEFVFCHVGKELKYLKSEEIWAIIREDEGITVIIERETAGKLELPYESVFRRITLTIHSSLDAVGLTAAVSTKLAENGISANVVAAFYHDHIFVQKEKAGQAMLCLRELAEDSQ